MNEEPQPIQTLIDAEIRRFITHLPPAGDPTLTILKGHLLLEELIRDLINSKLSKPEYLRETHLEFDQCLVIAKALTGDQFSGWVWKALKKLNKLRNDLAHNLEPKGMEDRITDFVSFLHPHLDGTGGDQAAQHMSPLNWSICGLYIGLAIQLKLNPNGGKELNSLPPEA